MGGSYGLLWGWLLWLRQLAIGTQAQPNTERTKGLSVSYGLEQVKFQTRASPTRAKDNVHNDVNRAPT